MTSHSAMPVTPSRIFSDVEPVLKFARTNPNMRPIADNAVIKGARRKINAKLRITPPPGVKAKPLDVQFRSATPSKVSFELGNSEQRLVQKLVVQTPLEVAGNRREQAQRREPSRQARGPGAKNGRGPIVDFTCDRVRDDDEPEVREAREEESIDRHETEEEVQTEDSSQGSARAPSQATPKPQSINIEEKKAPQDSKASQTVITGPVAKVKEPELDEAQQAEKIRAWFEAKQHEEKNSRAPEVHEAFEMSFEEAYDKFADKGEGFDVNKANTEKGQVGALPAGGKKQRKKGEDGEEGEEEEEDVEKMKEQMQEQKHSIMGYKIRLAAQERVLKRLQQGQKDEQSRMEAEMQTMEELQALEDRTDDYCSQKIGQIRDRLRLGRAVVAFRKGIQDSVQERIDGRVADIVRREAQIRMREEGLREAEGRMLGASKLQGMVLSLQNDSTLIFAHQHALDEESKRISARRAEVEEREEEAERQQMLNAALFSRLNSLLTEAGGGMRGEQRTC